MKSVGLIIAKKESSRLKDKNFRDFCGKPMFVWSLEKCLKVFDEVYVSSDYDYILEESKKLGGIPIKRPEELCRSEVMNVPVYQHALDQMDNPDVVIAVKADSPTVKIELIQQIKELMEKYGHDEIMTAYPVKGYVDKSPTYGSVWALSRKKIINYKDPLNPEPEILVVDPSIDIHTEEDLIKAKAQLDPGELDNNYQVWRKVTEPANPHEFIIGRTLSKELYQKNFRDISIQYCFIIPEDAERVFKIIPLSWESIKGRGIDLGGGIGCMSSILAKKDEVEKVYCVEYTEDLVKLCQPVMKRAILGEKVDKVISVVGDFDNLELEDNSLDFAIAWDSIHHSHNPVKTLKECHRVLKPDGKLIIVDRAHNNSTPDSEIERMHNIVYDKEYLRKNYLDENMILTRKDNGEHEWRFYEWDKFFEDSGFKLIEGIVLKTDTEENRELKNDNNLEEIFTPFNLGGFGHRKVGFVLEAT